MYKICKRCGKEFVAKGNKRYCGTCDYIKCAVCGAEFRIKQETSLDFPVCSPKCQGIKTHLAWKKKTREELNEIENKRKQTRLRKYGYEHHLQNPKILQDMMNKKLEEYGYSTFNMNTTKKTCQERYNVNNPAQLETNLFKIKNPQKNKESKLKTIQTNIKKYGVPYSCMRKEARKFSGCISKVNKSFMKLLEDNNIKYKQEKVLKYSENNWFQYDIEILNKRILIEIDPSVTHNIDWNPRSNSGIQENYHYNKTKCAIDNNYLCIHVFDWINWNDVINFIQNYSEDKFKIIKSSFDKSNIKLHWYNVKTKEHYIDNNFEQQKMFDNKFMRIYDDGLDMFY